MKIPLSWLKEFLPIQATAEEIAKHLVSLGMEVESITGLETSFKGVVVGKVLHVEKHPNADRLRVAKVSDGTQAYQVVCGAPNCREGITVAFARIGAELTDEEGKKWKIKRSKIRDVESEGMLCSPKELHLSEEHEGIIELPPDLSLGSDLAGFVTDPVFEVSLTPNLGHCLSVLGIARELAASFKMQVKRPKIEVKETGHQKMEVTISDDKLCPRYACRIMTGVKVGPSPEWMQKRLIDSGHRPINNLVDVSNYVMLEMGQPLHIFDKAKIVDEKIFVRPSTSFVFETLDGQKREIPPQTLLIEDPSKPLAIAGIMGGLSSAATDATREIVIESAVFDAASIRKSARLLDLKTDAAIRFDRGIDGALCVEALNRAATLIQEIAGGDIHPLVDVQPASFAPRKLTLRLAYLQKILGFHLSISEITQLFERLEMQVKVTENIFEIAVPTYRNDIQQEIDLTEEIGRLYGYDNIPRRPPIYSGSTLPDTPIYRLEKEVRELLLQNGLQECITCNLISPALAKLAPEKNNIHVLHPRSEDQSILRTSLMPGLLQVVKHNFNHQTKDLLAFEIGRVHFLENEHAKEISCVGLIFTGKTRPEHFDRKPHDVDFYDLKGVIENLFSRLRLLEIKFEPSHLPTLHPWRQAKIKSGDITLGVLGQLHPQLLTSMDISERVYFAEINLHDILPLKKKLLAYTEIPTFPASERDWTLTLKEHVPIATIFEAIKRTKSPFLEDFQLIDFYTSDQLGKDRKNVTFRFIYRDPSKTLSYDIVEKEHHRLTQSVAEKLHDCL